MAYRKPLTLTIIGASAIGITMAGGEQAGVLLVFGFLFYLVFGE